MPLTDAQIKAYKPLDKPYKSPKEQGLFLLVNPNGSRLWRHAYSFIRPNVAAMGWVWDSPSVWTHPQTHRRRPIAPKTGSM